MKRPPRKGSKQEEKLFADIRARFAKGYKVPDLVIWYEVPVSRIHEALGITRITLREDVYRK